MKNYIMNQIADSAATKQAILENEPLINLLVEVAGKCVDVYRKHKKILIAGNGGSAADAQHFAAELVGRYGFDRPSLPSISTSGNSQNVLNAFESAKERGITTVALVGRDGGKMANVADYAIIVPSNATPRIQESHLLIEHMICDIIEKEIFGGGVA